MLTSTVLPLIAAISVASPAETESGRLSVVGPRGRVLVSLDRTRSWLSVHDCSRPSDLPDSEDATAARLDCSGHPRRAAMAWIDPTTLYIACTGDRLWRWQGQTARAERVALSPKVDSIDALSVRDRELLIADERGAIWSYHPDHEPVLVALAPEPVQALAASGSELAVAGRSVWSWSSDRESWTLVAPVRACALLWVRESNHAPAFLWLAGPDGLMQITRTSIRVHGVAPMTGIALDRGALVLADGQRLSWLRVPTDDSPGSAIRDPIPQMNMHPMESSVGLLPGLSGLPGLPGPRFDRSRLATRARWSRWLPRLSAGISIGRTRSGRISYDIRLWLGWTPGTDLGEWP